MKRRSLAFCALLALLLSLAACGVDETAVFVQSVSQLQTMSALVPGDRFGGIVVSEDTTQIEKDPEMTVEELLVKAGDDVKEGQPLFSYDTQQLQLNLDKQKLELEQLKATIENYQQQIADLEKERAAAENKLEYTIQIQSTQLDLKEAQINLVSKEDAVLQSEEMLANATVTSPVTGRVQAVSESGTDNYGNPKPYITIQKTGTYRIKGMLGELQRGAIMEGTRMEAVSRTDETQVWTGTVTLVDYESPSQGSQNEMYYGVSTDEMSAASKYPFYIELDSTEGLLLGQHLYLQLEGEDTDTPALSLSSGFICYEEDGSTYVWAQDRGKLTKRTVELGQYQPMTDSFEILSGLAGEDYIAFPDPEVCVEGAPTTRTEPDQDTQGADTVPESGV